MIVEQLGKQLDTMSFGSYAHRLRAYWCNRSTAEELQSRAEKMTWPEEKHLQDILQEDRRPRRVVVPDPSQQVACNVVGRPRRALPTLMATPDSYAYRVEGGVPGARMIYDTTRGEWIEPTAKERELAMGFPAGVTAAAGLTERGRENPVGGLAYAMLGIMEEEQR